MLNFVYFLVCTPFTDRPYIIFAIALFYLCKFEEREANEYFIKIFGDSSI